MRKYRWLIYGGINVLVAILIAVSYAQAQSQVQPYLRQVVVTPSSTSSVVQEKASC